MLNNYPIFRVIYGLTKRARKFSDNYKLLERNLFLRKHTPIFDKHEHLIGSKIICLVNHTCQDNDVKLDALFFENPFSLNDENK